MCVFRSLVKDLVGGYLFIFLALLVGADIIDGIYALFTRLSIIWLQKKTRKTSVAATATAVDITKPPMYQQQQQKLYIIFNKEKEMKGRRRTIHYHVITTPITL